MNAPRRIATVVLCGLLAASAHAQEPKSASAPAPDPTFTYTPAHGKQQYVGHLDPQGHLRGKGMIQIIDSGDNLLSVPIQKIDSIVLTPRREKPAECRYYSPKAVVTLVDGSSVEGCFGSAPVKLVTSTVTVENVGGLNGRIVRNKQ
jgi:hypothetical protein